MRRVLCIEFPKGDRGVQLNEDEAVHVTQVLRMRDGEVLEALNGQGIAQTVRLELRKGSAWIRDLGVEATVQRLQGPRDVVPMVLEVAVLKGDAMDWVIEKSVELGVSSLQPLMTDYTVVQLDKKGPEKFVQRWQRIADQALKQCSRLSRMEILSPISVQQLPSQFKGQRFWCDESQRENVSDLRSTVVVSGSRVLIGPEGGWSPSERQLLSTLARPVSLGPLVLRAETAAIFCASVVAAEWRAT